MILSVGYRFTRRTFLGLTSLFFAVGLLSGERPNVVIILADDLGIGDVSAYNENSAWQTPHIDRLAREGMRYDNAYVRPPFALLLATRC